MISIQFEDLQLWQFSNLGKCNEISHFISGRNGGCSTGELGGLNLSFKVNDAELNVLQNRKLLSEAMNVAENHLVFPEQTHSDKVAILKNLNSDDSFSNTDALITNQKGVCIAVMSAIVYQYWYLIKPIWLLALCMQDGGEQCQKFLKRQLKL